MMTMMKDEGRKTEEREISREKFDLVPPCETWKEVGIPAVQGSSCLVQLVPETRINRWKFDGSGRGAKFSPPRVFLLLRLSSPVPVPVPVFPAIACGGEARASTRKGNRCSGSSVFRDNCDWSRGSRTRDAATPCVYRTT